MRIGGEIARIGSGFSMGLKSTSSGFTIQALPLVLPGEPLCDGHLENTVCESDGYVWCGDALRACVKVTGEEL